MFVCPVCREALQREPARWFCGQGHSFDVAREGYVNLLPAQHKNSREPGDSADSLKARREFLEAGHYGALRDAVAGMAAHNCARALLDIGCGEGWYTGGLVGAADAVVGIDIAKPAIRLAARRHPGTTWIVGSSALLPLADASIDVVTSIFSHLHPREMHRALAPRGRAIIAAPGPDHLHALREGLFEEVRPHAPGKTVAAMAAGFSLQETLEVRIALRLANESLRQLIRMTPYAWKSKPARRAELESRPMLETEAVFSLMCFERTGAEPAAA